MYDELQATWCDHDMSDQRMLELRLQRSISEYRYLECQLGEMKYAMECFADSFNRDFEADIIEAKKRRAAQSLDGASQPLVDQHDTNMASSNTDDGPSRLARRVYKRLALVLHPDKPTGSLSAFRSLEEAYREKDTLKLLLIADTAKVTIIDMYTGADDMSASLGLIQTKVANIKASVAWAWYDAVESDRPALRIKIVDTLSKVSLR